MKERFLMGTGLIGFLLVVGLLGGWESSYSRLAICSNYSNGVYTFTDNSGNDWEWEQEKGDNFVVGNAYRLKMDDNHTSSIYDDRIVKIQKN